MKLISSFAPNKGGILVEKFLTNVNGNPGMKKVITLGETSNCKLKQLGVDTITIETRPDGYRNTTLKMDDMEMTCNYGINLDLLKTIKENGGFWGLLEKIQNSPNGQYKV